MIEHVSRQVGRCDDVDNAILIGSFNNDDSDESENVTIKMN